jgi:hypothetical protein
MRISIIRPQNVQVELVQLYFIHFGLSWVQPHSAVDYSRVEVNEKIVGFDSMRRRKSPPKEGFTGNPVNSDSMF